VSTTLSRFATKEPTLCAVCRRHAVWLGYAPKHRGAMIWLCDDNRCHAAARKVYGMSNGTLDAYELGAALEAGSDAGAYLDEVGQTDMASLTRDQWLEFLRRIVTGYEHALRRMILDNEPPF
jgi:Family of unknown function (DUF6511)